MTVAEEFINRLLEAHVEVVRHRDHLNELKSRRRITASVKKAIPTVEIRLFAAEDRVNQLKVSLLDIIDSGDDANARET